MLQGLKQQFWLRTLKWHLYKKKRGQPHWKAEYLFHSAVRKLSPGDVVIDCGANIGSITTRFAKTGATVYAFEPDEYSFQRLQVASAGFENVICRKAAVGVKTGKVKLYRVPDFGADPEFNSLSSSVFADKKNISRKVFTEVDQIDLLRFINDLKTPVRILKLDIEGAEVPILEKILYDLIFSQIGIIFAETHENKIPQLTARTLQLRQRVADEYSYKVNLDWN